MDHHLLSFIRVAHKIGVLKNYPGSWLIGETWRNLQKKHYDPRQGIVFWILILPLPQCIISTWYRDKDRFNRPIFYFAYATGKRGKDRNERNENLIW